MEKILLPLLGAVLFFAACGDENTTVVATSDAEKVMAFKDLDDCDSAIVGKLVYVKDSVKAFICTDDGWAAMSGAVVENGSDGSDGKDGKDGKAGKDGKNGTDGKDGSSCTVKAIKGGYKVLCGGDSVGVLMNGAKGESGAQGIQGEAGESAFELSGFEGTLDEWIESLKGENGTSCNIENDEDGAVTIKCGTGKKAVTTTLYKAVCGDAPYDPDGDKFCYGVELYDKCGSPKAAYNPDNQFCAKFADDAEQIYKKVTIAPVGTGYFEIWMAENLNYETAEGSFCAGKTEDEQAAFCAKYGRLYTWATAVGRSESECGEDKNCTTLSSGDVQGVCPVGWHLPSEQEWEALIVAMDGNITEYVGSNKAGETLKSKTGWTEKSGIVNADAYSFAALPAGLYNGTNFRNEGTDAYFWTSVQKDQQNAYVISLSHEDNKADSDSFYKDYGFSVRCIKD